MVIADLYPVYNDSWDENVEQKDLKALQFG